MTGRGPRGLIRPAAAAVAESRSTYVYRMDNGSVNQFVVPSSGTGHATPGAPLAYIDDDVSTVADLRLEGRTAAAADVTFEIQRSADQGTTWAALSTPFSVTVSAGNKTAMTAGPSVALSDGDWVSLKCTADNGGALGEWGLSFRI